MQEMWKSIAGFPDYEVSNLGRVKSLGRFVKIGRGERWKKRTNHR